MAVKFTNNATSLLAGNIDETSTTISVLAGDAGKFPTLSPGEWFPLTIVDGSGKLEILKATARVGSVITVERGREGTTATDFAAGARVDLRLTSASLEAMDGWALQPIGVPIPLLSGAPLPAKNKSYRYIILSAGQSSAGNYNEGALSDETVNGTAPTLTATAKIALSSSPMNGQTIHLINTSKLFLRPGTSEVIEGGQNLSHTHTASTNSTGAHTHTGTAASGGAHTHTASTGSAGAHTHTISPMTSRNVGGTSWPAWEAGGASSKTTSSAGAHTHTVTVNSGGAHTHSVTTVSAGEHSHTVTVGNNGGDENRPRNMNIQYLLRIA